MEILLVDDDPDLLDSAAMLLTACGYSITKAENANVALSLLESRASVRVLLTDIVMPGMSGFELANRARLLRPDLCIIYMTGYSPDALPDVQQLHGTVLLKPWPVERLLHEIDRCAS
jgi:CheY-like chemotaxis protein